MPGPRRIIVGASGSPGSLRALRYAADLARVSNVPLVPVIAWTPPGGDLAERRGASARTKNPDGRRGRRMRATYRRTAGAGTCLLLMSWARASCYADEFVLVKHIEAQFTALRHVAPDGAESR